MTSLTELSLIDMQRGLQAGAFSSRELVQATLDKISDSEPSLHAFLHVPGPAALRQADQADQARKQKADSQPLLGIPMAIKDVLTVEGLPCTCGSRILEGFVPPYTATSVQRLLDAGVVIIGKTNTDEFAMGSSTENSAYGVTHNPWDLERVPGGSSGGSAAAVAARCVPAALGTDTGGSVRQPASFCGVTGLKTTYGRVSRYGLVAFGSSLDTVGAFGRTAEDLTAVFSVMSGRDPRDATSADVGVPEISLAEVQGDAPLRGMRIGVPREYFAAGIQPGVEAAVRAALDVLHSLGAEMREVSLPHTEYALPVYYIIAPAEASANLARFDGVRYGPREHADDMWDVYYRTRGARFGPEVTRRIMIGTYALSAGYYDAYYAQAQRVRTLIRRDFEAVFADCDLIAAPTAPGTAFKIGAHENDPLAMYLEDVFTLPANLAGLPGLSFNAGFDEDDLPIGLQLIAPHFREDVLLRTAHAYQQITDWHARTPVL
jgi:aspartyl-tRNA(Asn)/glutamyl-tRNA(Gln) amidotransferase subunit A